MITISLNTPDIDYIKRHDTLCFHRNTCWLALTSSTVYDTSGNPVKPILTSHATYSLYFIADEHPYLDYFDISIEEGTLLLYFNEPVNVEYLDPTAITLQSTQNISSPNEGITLTGGMMRTFEE